MSSQSSAIEVSVSDETISDFIEHAGWGDATRHNMGADMGLRRYERLMRSNGTALFMDMSRAGVLETGLKAYMNVAEFFNEQGINVPEVYGHDLSTGLSLIEDLGGVSFGAALKSGTPKEDIYRIATEVLVKIDRSAKENVLSLNGYEDTLIRKRLSQFVDYYMPFGAGRMTTQADQDEFQNVLAEIEKNIPPCPMAICHADYHLENLMWQPDVEGGYGLIDFQDAFWGPQPYDLLNLLEDARVSVPDDIKTAMKAKYCEGMSAEEKEAFDAWYVYMSAHFHCRVIGLFIKFSKENNGTEFLQHIPRLQNYLKNNLKNPILSPLKDFIDKHKISLEVKVN